MMELREKASWYTQTSSQKFKSGLPSSYKMLANGIKKNCKNFENIFIRDECNDAKKLNYHGPVAKNSYSLDFLIYRLAGKST